MPSESKSYRQRRDAWSPSDWLRIWSVRNIGVLIPSSGGGGLIRQQTPSPVVFPCLLHLLAGELQSHPVLIASCHGRSDHHHHSRPSCPVRPVTSVLSVLHRPGRLVRPHPSCQSHGLNRNPRMRDRRGIEVAPRLLFFHSTGSNARSSYAMKCTRFGNLTTSNLCRCLI